MSSSVSAMASSSKVLNRDDFANRTDWVEADLRRRITAQEWKPGQRISTEHVLSSDYAVSRPTVRGALARLESAGYVRSQRGSGTFAMAQPEAVHGDLRVLESMTATIERHGLVATSVFAEPEVRPATAEEASRLHIEEGEAVLVTAREILASDMLVAFSTEVTPRAGLGTVDGEALKTSMFEFLERTGVSPTQSHTEIHATASLPAWYEPTTTVPDGPFLRLDQCHFGGDGNPIMWSQSYYVEGRFTFALNRVRPPA